MLINDLMPQLLGDVLGCPDPTARNALRNAVIEFCTDTLAWAEDLDEITVRAEEGAYELDTPPEARVSLILSATLNGQQLIGKSMSEVKRLVPAWQTERSHPAYFNAVNDNALMHLYPMPSVTGGVLRVRVAFTPTITANRLDDKLVNENFEGLLSGAKQRLMLMPGKAWSNSELGVYHAGLFQRAKEDRRIDIAYGGAAGSITVKPRRFI